MSEVLEMELVIDIFRGALLVALKLSLPLLMVGLVVGLAVSMFQAMTQIQEQTLTFIPKILAVIGALMLTMPLLLRWIVEYTRDTLVNLDGLWPGSGV